MNERALMVIISALSEYEKLPRKDWTQSEAENATLSRWSMDEILDLVWGHPWTSASDTIAAFAIMMEACKATAKTANQQLIFSIAAETAWELLEDVEQVER